ncbi:MAG: T6SS immunity protein Tli4 family protein [Terriglobales bacterium]
MTEKMKPVCVGRYLVDVPAQAELSLLRERMAGFEIDTVEEDETKFRARVRAREATIKAKGAKADSTGPGGMIEARDLRISGMVGRSLVFGRTGAYGIKEGHRVDDEWVSVETHAHVGGVSFSLSKEFADETDITLAETLLGRLQVREEGEIPTVPGFCIRRAIFVEPLPTHKTEHAAMHLGLPGHADLAMTLASMPGDGAGRGLLFGTAEVDAAAGHDEMLRVSKLRSDKRKINGIDGEELIERVREHNFTTGYAFNWETQGDTDDVMRPYLSLEMQTGVSHRPGGKPTNTSLHEDALLALWDSITSTLRPHTPGPRQATAPPPALAR